MRTDETEYKNSSGNIEAIRATDEKPSEVLAKSDNIRKVEVITFSVVAVIILIIILLGFGVIQPLFRKASDCTILPSGIRSVFYRMSLCPSFFRSKAKVDTTYIDRYGVEKPVEEDAKILEDFFKENEEKVTCFIEGRAPTKLSDYDIYKSGLTFKTVGFNDDIYILKPSDSYLDEDSVKLYLTGRSRVYDAMYIEDGIKKYTRVRFVGKAVASLAM